MTRPLRIAIDGPSGSGKSTLGRELARRLGLPYVDTGAMYRAVGWAVGEAGLEDEGAIAEFAEGLDLEVDPDADRFRVRVNGIDVTGKIRDPEIGRLASRVSAIERVRGWLVPQQRRIGAAGGVLEGRDIGTVVFPDAECKFYVIADEETRMARRAAQWGIHERKTVTQQNSAASRTRMLKRAQRTGWLFDRHVDVGISGPSDFDNAITCQRTA